MSTILYELPDRYVLDTGQVVGKHVRAIKAILAGQPLHLSDLTYVDSNDLTRYAQQNAPSLKGWTSGDPEDPPEHTRNWQIPDKYLTLDLHDHLRQALIDFLTQHDDLDPKVYSDRFDREWNLIEAKRMTGLIRALIYMIDVFRERNVVWGVGRGSSVESLILFLIGVHRIDPIRYDIPLEHFFRDK